MMFRDSASITLSSNGINSALNGSSLINIDPIFYDGTSTKLKVGIQGGSNTGIYSKIEIYNLPGSLPCIQCSTTGTVSTTGLSGQNNNPNINEAVFYPNPVTDQLKLKYSLPRDYKTAEIRIQDIQGMVLETYKVTDTFEYIYVPSNYNNGLYLYSLFVDGALIKTEKVILDK